MRIPFSVRSLALLSVAILAGLLAAWAAGEHIQQRLDTLENTARVPQVQRLVAARHLSEGLVISADDLAVRNFPASVVSSDSLAPERFTDLVGRRLQGELKAGDPVLVLHTAAVATTTSFSARLGAGRRAITLPVDAINSVSGLLEPGDLIDLYVSFDYRRRRMTVPLLQGVLVLATGSRSDNDRPLGDGLSAYSTVTLDTSPEDAVKLVAARQGGTITAVLRSPDDNLASQRAVRGDLATILGVGTPTPQTAVRKRAPVIYGNIPVRTLASLVPGVANTQSGGLFNLPYMPELVSVRRTDSGSTQNTASNMLRSEQTDPNDGRDLLIDGAHVFQASGWPSEIGPMATESDLMGEDDD